MAYNPYLSYLTELRGGVRKNTRELCTTHMDLRDRSLITGREKELQNRRGGK